MQSSAKEEKFDNFATFWDYSYNLNYKQWIEMILEPF